MNRSYYILFPTIGMVIFNLFLALENYKIETQLIDNTAILRDINQVISNKVENAHKIRKLKSYHGRIFAKYLDKLGNLRCEYFVTPNINCPIEHFNDEAFNYNSLGKSGSVFAFKTCFFTPRGYFRSIESDVVYYGSYSSHPYLYSEYYGKKFYTINDQLVERNKNDKFVINKCDSIKIKWHAVALNYYGELDTFIVEKRIKRLYRVDDMQ